jgi:vacuolar-type H+-ATPase catalytic subunit A/Vma1
MRTMKTFDEIRIEAREYAVELESAFRDLRTVESLTDGWSERMQTEVRAVSLIFERMDRDERIPRYVTDFYRKIYRTIIAEEQAL